MDTPELLPITSIPSQLGTHIGYRGEARYLALMPGLGGEMWYDDGAFTGLTRLRLEHFLSFPPIAPYANHFCQRNGGVAHWFLLDQHTQNLLLGTQEAVSAYLRYNARPQVPIWQAGEHPLCHEPYQY